MSYLHTKKETFIIRYNHTDLFVCHANVTIQYIDTFTERWSDWKFIEIVCLFYPCLTNISFYFIEFFSYFFPNKIKLSIGLCSRRSTNCSCRDLICERENDQLN